MAGSTVSATDRRIAPFGSIVITTSAPLAASLAVLKMCKPSASTGAVSNPLTSCPAAIRLSAIGLPILPKPINPTFMIFSSKRQFKRAKRCAHGFNIRFGNSHNVMFPLRHAVFVNDGCADPFEEISMFHSPRGKPVLQSQCCP